MSQHTALQFDNHIKWLQFSVKPLLLEQWGRRQKGRRGFKAWSALLCIAIVCPQYCLRLCMDTSKMGYLWPDVAPHWSMCRVRFAVADAAGKHHHEMGRLYIDSRATVIEEALKDMQNILGFAATGNIAAMKRVFADQSSMVRHICNSGCAGCSPHNLSTPINLAPQVDSFSHTPFMLVGLSLASVRPEATGELSGSSAAMQALMFRQWEAAVWLLQQPGGARLDVFADAGSPVTQDTSPHLSIACCEHF